MPQWLCCSAGPPPTSSPPPPPVAEAKYHTELQRLTQLASKHPALAQAGFKGASLLLLTVDKLQFLLEQLPACPVTASRAQAEELLQLIAKTAHPLQAGSYGQDVTLLSDNSHADLQVPADLHPVEREEQLVFFLGNLITFEVTLILYLTMALHPCGPYLLSTHCSVPHPATSRCAWFPTRISFDAAEQSGWQQLPWRLARLQSHIWAGQDYVCSLGGPSFTASHQRLEDEDRESGRAALSPAADNSGGHSQPWPDRAPGVHAWSHRQADALQV